MSETIGDDLKQICEKAKEDGKVPLGKHIIYCNTPSYVGSHVTGYSNMVAGMVNYFSESTGKINDRINLISGWVEPSDMREVKRLATMMGAKFTLFPDTSDVVDTPMTGTFEMYPKGGTSITELIASGDNKATLAFGEWATKDAAIKLENKCKVPFELADLPIGIKATDRFIQKMSKLAEVTIPDEITAERGKLIDIITDMHQYLYGKRVALWGDPDQLIPMVEFLVITSYSIHYTKLYEFAKFTPLILLIVLSGCAASYRPINPTTLNYNSHDMQDGIALSYKYDVSYNFV